MGTINGKVIRRRLRIEGVVQGVGFRPYIYRLATHLGLSGFVRNDVVGVSVEVEGPSSTVDRFLAGVHAGLPEMSHISRMIIQILPTTLEGPGFTIVETDAKGSLRVAVTPDAHVCDTCVEEMCDPGDRRFRYPFINCTHCGPRFTIVEQAPYDRCNTTMAAFEMCDACRAEYEDPRDRRFHAQPVACPACGPRLWLVTSTGKPIDSSGDPITNVRQRLLAGQTIAVKGIGGFHLAVLASSNQAVSALRRHKGRGDRKPLAVMVANLAQAREIATLTEEEANLLQSPSRPIVLLQRLPGADIAPEVAPGLDTIGVMLPYSPVHHLLLEPPMPALVMTSGNASEEPITTDNQEAIERLGHLCDALLLHDRGIHAGCDDSVTQVVDGRPQILRRSRGYVPRPLDLAKLNVETGVLALGGEMKGAICLSRAGQLIMGRHLGELSNVAAQENLRVEIRRMTQLLGITPRVIAHDLHPDYFTSRLAHELSSPEGLEHIAVQHHHAHLASCLAENDFPQDKPVLGIIFDGTGYGPDGTIWGGEFLVGSYNAFRRAAYLRPVALPGGDAAIRSPFRSALAHLLDAIGPTSLELDLPAFTKQPRPLLDDLHRMIRSNLGCPRSSGTGRLFDAVAAIVGVPGGLADPISYEAQPAIELEAAAARHGRPLDQEEAYPFDLTDTGEIDCGPIIRSVVDDVHAGEQVPAIAARFHATIVRLASTVANRIAAAEGLRHIALSGGCFHNRLLLSHLSRELRQQGYNVLQQERVPCGDGGLALGQAAVAAAKLSSECHIQT